jgi:hypothetical protein
VAFTLRDDHYIFASVIKNEPKRSLSEKNTFLATAFTRIIRPCACSFWFPNGVYFLLETQ